MKNFLEYANSYVDQCDLKDFGLLKICLCAIGVIIGLSIPEKKRKCPLMAAGLIFIFTYALLMAKFIKVYLEVSQEKYIH